MPDNRRVVVTGASGLVGAGVIEELRRAGYEVVGLSRRNTGGEHGNIPWIESDLRGDFERELDRFLPIHGLIHLAALLTPPQDEALAALRAVNMTASERLFGYCALRGVDKVVYSGSLGILSRPLQSPITERHPIGPVLPYHVSKYWGELALHAAAGKHAFVGLVLRISSPVGSRLDRLPPTVIRRWLTLARQGRPVGLWGRGDRTQDFVAVEDVGAAVVLGLDKVEASDTVHIGSGRPTSMRELAETIASLGRVRVEVASPSDPNEDERWNVDLTRARHVLGYAPRFTIFDYLPALWEQASCVAR